MPAAAHARALRCAARRAAHVLRGRRRDRRHGQHGAVPALPGVVREQRDREPRDDRAERRRQHAGRLQLHAVPLPRAGGRAVLQPARVHGAVDHLRLPAVPAHRAARPGRPAARASCSATSPSRCRSACG